jgi:hypothetical protein
MNVYLIQCWSCWKQTHRENAKAGFELRTLHIERKDAHQGSDRSFGTRLFYT